MGQDPSQIRDEVDQARENLGETVEALAYKANAPKRAKEAATDKFHAARDAAATRLSQLRHRAQTWVAYAKARVAPSDPGVRQAQGPAIAVTETTPNSHVQGGSGRGVLARLQPAVDIAKRHPRATATASLAALGGIIVGRLTKS